MDAIIPSLSKLIEIAVAPVFLLAGIAGFLNVMSGRLGRISDRVRVAELNIDSWGDRERTARIRLEILVLWRRVKVINWAIGLCVASALMVCTVIVCLFAGELWHFDLKVLIVTLFVLAMLLLISALIVFLIEVRLATSTINIVRTVR
ncbi:DUF2721 domain-containing protein [Alteromonas aestuariivivens]|uniref:DUF2721 domain-containing protein n=1 Tax=Alteromonas aestuariivivens TaxID=1938339 RepID=A0A3D8M9T2_9ALTE|nr:DUF2721 domain-containing protein [Alteromonas aestuariivivens]RDV26777.1 DUF2721 domain-containing protein [Alteromonas aestuariivivens]